MAETQLNLYDELMTYENFVHAISGMTGGVTAITTFYPLNNIGIRMRVDDKIKPGHMIYVAQQIRDLYGYEAFFQGLCFVFSYLI